MQKPPQLWSSLLTSISLKLMLFGCLLFVVTNEAQGVTFTIGSNFEGTDLTTAFGLSSGAIPPDTMGAVGPNHVVELINTSFAVYNKVGTLQSRVSLNNFWDTAFSNAGNPGFVPNATFDPRILYEANTNRWYAAAVDTRSSPNSRLLIGVTTGSDPSAANWRAFEVDADTPGTRWADFPTMGINGDALYISNNMFDNPGGIAESSTVTMVGVPLSSLTAGVPGISGFRIEQNIDPNRTGFSVQPVFDMDAGTGTHVAVSSFNGSFNKRTTIPSNWITGGSNIGPQVFPADFAAQSVTAPGTADQPGASVNIHTGDRRFSGNVILQNGSLWGVQTVDNGGLAALRWYEFTDVAGQFTIKQTGLISDSSLDLYYPSIAVNDDGLVVIGFSGSDATTPVSTYVAVGETLASITSFDPILLTHLGTGEYQRLDTSNRNRWGDYSSTVLDPSDPDSFWTFQEYVDGNNNWAIRITQINIGASETGVSIVPEPSTLSLVGLFCFMATSIRRRRCC